MPERTGEPTGAVGLGEGTGGGTGGSDRTPCSAGGGIEGTAGRARAFSPSSHGLMLSLSFIALPVRNLERRAQSHPSALPIGDYGQDLTSICLWPMSTKNEDSKDRRRRGADRGEIGAPDQKVAGCDSDEDDDPGQCGSERNQQPGTQPRVIGSAGEHGERNEDRHEEPRGYDRDSDAALDHIERSGTTDQVDARTRPPTHTNPRKNERQRRDRADSGRQAGQSSSRHHVILADHTITTGDSGQYRDLVSAHAVAADLLGRVPHANDTSERLELHGPQAVLPSSFAVTEAAGALVGAVGVAIDRVAQVRAKSSPNRVSVDLVHAGLAFQSERHLRFEDDAPQLWDGLAGYYPVKDGSVQFHTNFDHHRLAVLTALGLAPDADRAAVEAAVIDRTRFEVEDLVTAQGGIAAAVREVDEWDRHPHARTPETSTPLTIERETGPARSLGSAPLDRPLAGLRVLDLTRIIAGPVCTRTLAAYGADVLRVGAVNLPVVRSILADSTLGKRFCHLDLDDGASRHALLRLAADADVVVAGFRPGSLAARGLGSEDLLEANPDLVVAELSAFGTSGPWGGRRGFDSITQSATGIVAEETAAFGSGRLTPLPCQLLDHGSGHLLTIGVIAGLLGRHEDGGGHRVAVSLLGTRNWFVNLGRRDHTEVSSPDDSTIESYCDRIDSPWGRIRHVRHPDPIDGIPARWERGPTRPGTNPPAWLDRE